MRIGDRLIATIALGVLLLLGPIAIQLAPKSSVVSALAYACLTASALWLAHSWVTANSQNEASDALKISTYAIASLASIGSALLDPGLVAKFLAAILTLAGATEDLTAPLKAISENTAANAQMAQLVTVGVTLIALAGIYVSRQQSISHRPTSLSKQDWLALQHGINLQLDRLNEEFNFLTKNSPFIALPLQESNRPSLRLKQTSIATRLAAAKPNSLMVVKGEPGSGKSLALRHAAKALCETVASTNRVPLYLNLREWDLPATGASQSNIDTSFYEWVRAACVEQINSCLARFFDDASFQNLYASGRLIFLFDSFDEIPRIVSAHHKSQAAREISGAIAAFIKASGGCVAAIGSRDYKSPEFGGVEHKVLTVPPFNDSHVRKYLAHSPHKDTILRCIYSDRPDLFVLSRSPLLLALLVHYFECNGGPPDSEYNLYESFVVERLTHFVEHCGFEQNTVSSSLEAAMTLAEKSIEHGAVDLTPYADQIVEALTRSKILGINGGKARFVHRRLMEYLRVRALLRTDRPRPKLAPGYLDQHYDLLVLYGSVCPAKKAKSLAADAAKQFRSGYGEYAGTSSNRGYVKMLMALRFFRDAFRSRPDIISSRHADITRIVVGLWHTDDLMRQKHAVEHICLVPKSLAAYLVSEALNTNCGWLKRAALFEARYIKDLQPDLSVKIAAYMSRLDDIAFGQYLKLLRSTLLLRSGEAIDRSLVYFEAFIRAALVSVFFISGVVGGKFAGGVVFAFVWLSIFWLSSGLGPSRWLPNSLSGIIAASVGWTTFWGIIKLVIGADNSLFGTPVTDQIFGSLLITLGGLLAIKVYISDFRMIQFKCGLDADMRALVRQLSQRPAMSLSTLQYWAIPIVLVALLIFSTYSELGKSIYGGVTGAIVILVLIYMLIHFGGWLGKKALEWFDFFTLKRVKAMSVSGRTDIEANLRTLKTAYGRSEYLRWLGSQADSYVRPLRSPDDEWTGAARPTFQEYYLNNHLAILDEQWRGLATR